MAIKDRATLKTYFETGDTPTQSQFADLIDSLLSIEVADAGLTAISSLGSTSKVVVIDAGDHDMYYTTVADILAYVNAHSTTDSLAEGSTNLYFTNARARAALSAGTGLSYNSSTGVYTLNTSTDNVTEGSTNKYYTDARARASVSTSGNELAYNSSTGVLSKNKALQTLSGGSVTFNVANGYNAKLSLTANATLTISNASAGEYYTLQVIQNASTAYTLSFDTPSNYKVISGGGGAVTITATLNAVDILTFFYDGSKFYTNIGKNYT